MKKVNWAVREPSQKWPRGAGIEDIERFSGEDVQQSKRSRKKITENWMVLVTSY